MLIKPNLLIIKMNLFDGDYSYVFIHSFIKLIALKAETQSIF